MKKSIYTLAFAALVAGMVFTSCKSPADKVEAEQENVLEAEQDLDEAKRDYNQEYSQFKSESEARITANEKVIADLKEYSIAKKKETRMEYEKAINDLESKNQAMKAKIADYKKDGNDNWESFKNEINHDMNEIGESLNNLGKNNVK